MDDFVCAPPRALRLRADELMKLMKFMKYMEIYEIDENIWKSIEFIK